MYECEQRRRKLTYRILLTSEWIKLTAVRDHARCLLSWPLRTEITIGAFVMGEWFGYEGYLTEELVVTYRRMRTCDSNLLESLRRSDPSSSFALWLDRLS